MNLSLQTTGIVFTDWLVSGHDSVWAMKQTCLSGVKIAFKSLLNNSEDVFWGFVCLRGKEQRTFSVHQDFLKAPHTWKIL